jgi:hypothetical protein
MDHQLPFNDGTTIAVEAGSAILLSISQQQIRAMFNAASQEISYERTKTHGTHPNRR